MNLFPLIFNFTHICRVCALQLLELVCPCVHDSMYVLHNGSSAEFLCGILKYLQHAINGKFYPISFKT